MAKFAPLQNRDAYGVIRGYVYQVDLTIERWLELAPGQVLELECGEDIDTVSTNLRSEHRDRLLEQVKHRTTPLTLRHKGALSALACAVATLRSNPDINLTFRYTTNAEVTTERPLLFRRAVPAIEMWENIRTDQLSEAQQQQGIKNLASFLANASRPQDVGPDAWQEFTDFIASATNPDLLGFIKAFEWSRLTKFFFFVGNASAPLAYVFGVVDQSL